MIHDVPSSVSSTFAAPTNWPYPSVEQSSSLSAITEEHAPLRRKAHLTTQPLWRYVPFASALLMCSGLFVLQQGAPAPVRSSSGTGCDAVGVLSAPHSLTRTSSGDVLDVTDRRSGSGQPIM